MGCVTPPPSSENRVQIKCQRCSQIISRDQVKMEEFRLNFIIVLYKIIKIK